ncbi:hypothetical protein [Halostagnicola sp. A-GB9-2]|uniref:hypothetical protein n=1 Tax=Halostagnicola sp. A-GB9-2 TaxID=3048066 RepID=UPI0024C04FDB|nr:hypothetical protein [Halostagnicola sp. A-GB9-2]MDJ1430641.1 hypothetical protein [Halostagnicola sp. A-GB9-2]
MGLPLLEWFRDENGDWTVPRGRKGEFVALAVALPVLAYFVAPDPGALHPGWLWPVIPLGIASGLLYTRRYRRHVIDAIPEDTGSWVILTMLGGGFGLSTLEALGLARPAMFFALAAGLTILSVYTLRLLSPLHDDCEPARRGVEPPSGEEPKSTPK